MFPFLNSNVLIPSMLLVAIGGWAFGRTNGLLIVMGAIVLHYFLFQFFADDYPYYSDRVTGYPLIIGIALLSGTLRQNLDAIREATFLLDMAVEERTRDLANMNRELIDRSEAMRVSHGQRLHDGIGQQLTGIQLYSSSLASSLVEESNASAALAHSLMNRARSTHELVRHAARSLFPVQIGRVGLFAAINEMVACFQETQQVAIHVHSLDHLPGIPQATALQIYRICQETTLFLLAHAQSSDISIHLAEEKDDLILSIAHDGSSIADHLEQSPALRLVEYRLKQVRGKMYPPVAVTNSERLRFIIPLQEKPEAA
jgi:signal transduction histidine kinase